MTTLSTILQYINVSDIHAVYLKILYDKFNF